MRHAILPLAAILLAALLALWAALLPLLRRTTRALERTLRARQEAEASLATTSDRLRQSQKMDAIGRLAGGVAHDFNNLLLAIHGYADFLVTGVTDTRLRSYAQEVLKAADQAAALTQQLLTFSRHQVLHTKVLDLNESVRDTEGLLRRVLDANVRIDLDLDPSLRAIEADPNQIGQVLLNLAINARDAMDGSGTLTIATANAGDQVALTISDTGVGMDEATRSRAFEPFFTTKDVGGGTGLGLATVYGIVSQTGGTVEIDSGPGRGTSIVIHFPPSQGSPVEELERSRPVPRGSERILLVEDQKEVRAVVSEMMRELGYQVICAGSPSEALTTRDPWDLLVTDIVMPEMTGVELVRRMGTSAVLFISGYDGQALVDQSAAYLQKPFTQDALARKLRELLDTRRAA